MIYSSSVALVLGAGGAKGYAHIGAIKAIEEAGLKVHAVAGTSMGALVGGLYAAGALERAQKWLQSMNVLEVCLLTDLKNISLRGLIDGEYIMEKLREFVSDVRIEDLPIDYCAVATDLDSGEEVVIRRGSLLEAIRMSISMPVIFAPYQKRGHRYVDGGLVNGLPINRVRRKRGDWVIAIDLDTYGRGSVGAMA